MLFAAVQSSTLMAAAIQGGYVNALPTLTSAAGGQLTSLSPPNGVTLSTVAPSSGIYAHLYWAPAYHTFLSAVMLHDLLQAMNPRRSRFINIPTLW